LAMAYVDVTQHVDESVVECRRRRRMELARGWRFACGCSRCAEEATAMTTEEAQAAATESEPKEDESKMEASLERFEAEETSNTVE
jgi:import receptor subunit TOM20